METEIKVKSKPPSTEQLGREGKTSKGEQAGAASEAERKPDDCGAAEATRIQCFQKESSNQLTVTKNKTK